MDEIVYDLYAYCRKGKCSFEKMAKKENEMSNVLMTTAVMNAAAAAYYFDASTVPREFWHDAYFDAYLEVGMSIGKMLRFMFEFE